MLNKLFAGITRRIEIPKGGCLFIHDEVPEIPIARVFDPHLHSFNPLKGIDYKKAREIADVVARVCAELVTLRHRHLS